MFADNFYQNAADYYNAQSSTCYNQNPEKGNLVSTRQVAQDIRAISKATKATGADGDDDIRYWGKSLTNVIDVSTDARGLFIWHAFGQCCCPLVP